MHVVYGGVIYMQMYKAENRTEPCGTSACIPLDADISPSAQSSNFKFQRKELTNYCPDINSALIMCAEIQSTIYIP